MTVCLVRGGQRWRWLWGSPRGLLQSAIIIIMSPSCLIQKLHPVRAQRVCWGWGGLRHGWGHRLHTSSWVGVTGIRPTALSCSRVVVVILSAVVVSMDLPSGRVGRGDGIWGGTEGDAGWGAGGGRGVRRARNGLLQVRNISIHCSVGVILSLMGEMKEERCFYKTKSNLKMKKKEIQSSSTNL